MATWVDYTSTSSTAYEPSGYWSKVYTEELLKPGQYMRSILGDFEKQNKQEDVEEPQTIFHFDPKEIVDKWPEKGS